MARCPGQDMRYWTPEDIFDVECPFCGREIEFWKDEPVRLCTGCGVQIRNPRIDLGCAKWCKSAKECLGTLAEEHVAAAPLIERVRAQLTAAWGDNEPERIRTAESVHAVADTLLSAEGGDPCVVKIAALLAGAGCEDVEPFLVTSGMEEERRRAVGDVVLKALHRLQPTTPEGAIVQDALRLARHRGAVSASPAETTSFLTRSAQLLAQRPGRS